MPELVIYIDARKAPPGIVRDVKAALCEHRGNVPVRIGLETSEGDKDLSLGVRVHLCDPLIEELEALLGTHAVVVWPDA